MTAPGAEAPDRDGHPSRGALAEAVHAALRGAGATLATAESLTGGLLAGALTDVPGASLTYRGGVVSYATDLKAGLLGIDPALLGRYGAVHPEVAEAMARGVRERLGATYGVATTGVAGPDPQDGRAPGEVYVAVAGPGVGASGAVVHPLRLTGDRAAIRDATVRRALAALGEVLPAAAGRAVAGDGNSDV